MITTIISTVGTSLLGNLAREKEGSLYRTLYDKRKWAQLGRELAALVPSERLLGAEINSLSQLLDCPGFENVSRLHFCRSATTEGEDLVEILKSYFAKSKTEYVVSFHSIEDLTDENPERFRIYGLRNLARIIGKLVRDTGSARYAAINCTGGYKAQVAVAVLIGQALGVEVYYKHEKFDSIISFPSMPVSFNYDLLDEYSDLLLALEEGGETIEAPAGRVEPIRSLLEEVQIGDTTLWALAPIGQIFLEGYRQRYPLEETLPPMSPEGERKMPTFGNDHHYPDGFKSYVQKVWKETPYIKFAFATDYHGQKNIKSRRFYLDSQSNLIGDFRSNKFGARFQLETTAKNAAQRRAMLMDLNSRFASH